MTFLDTPGSKFDLEAAIQATLPDGPGQRHRGIFEFARIVKFAEGFDKSPENLRVMFGAWHVRALPFIKDQAWQESWEDFQRGYVEAKSPPGSTPETARAKALADFKAALSNATNKRGSKNTEVHITVTLARARKVMDGCGFKFITDISPDKVEAYLNRLKRKRKEKDAEGNVVITEEILSIQSQNFYLAAAKQFCRWLVDSERTDRNPLTRLKRSNVALDRRHDRRAIALDELHLILVSARDSSVVFRGLTGLDRFWLYAVAMATGLRVSDLASLLPSGFHLDSVPPFV